MTFRPLLETWILHPSTTGDLQSYSQQLGTQMMDQVPPRRCPRTPSIAGAVACSLPPECWRTKDVSIEQLKQTVLQPWAAFLRLHGITCFYLHEQAAKQKQHISTQNAHSTDVRSSSVTVNGCKRPQAGCIVQNINPEVTSDLLLPCLPIASSMAEPDLASKVEDGARGSVPIVFNSSITEQQNHAGACHNPQSQQHTGIAKAEACGSDYEMAADQGLAMLKHDNQLQVLQPATACGMHTRTTVPVPLTCIRCCSMLLVNLHSHHLGMLHN